MCLELLWIRADWKIVDSAFRTIIDGGLYEKKQKIDNEFRL